MAFPLQEEAGGGSYGPIVPRMAENESESERQTQPSYNALITSHSSQSSQEEDLDLFSALQPEYKWHDNY